MNSHEFCDAGRGLKRMKRLNPRNVPVSLALLCSAHHICDTWIQTHGSRQPASSSAVCDTFSGSYWHADIAKNIMSNFAQSSTGTEIFIIKHLSSEEDTGLQERGVFMFQISLSRITPSNKTCAEPLWQKPFPLIFDVCLVLFVCLVLLLSVLFLVTTWLRGTRNKIRDFHL